MFDFTKNKKYLIISIFCALIATYYFLWVGQQDFFKISDLNVAQNGCYRYTSDSELKNIARHEIIRLYGLEALKEQRKLHITYMSATNEIAVAGRPYGLLKAMYLYFFVKDYVTPMTVIFVNSSNSTCITVQSALYQKN